VLPHPAAAYLMSTRLVDLNSWEEVLESTALVIHRGEIEKHAFEPRLPD